MQLTVRPPSSDPSDCTVELLATNSRLVDTNHATAKTTAPTSTRRFFASDDFAKRYGKTSPFDLLTEVNRYTLYDVVDDHPLRC